MEFITLNNLSRQKLIKDVIIRPLKINKDDSGILVETLRRDWLDIYKDGFAMQYYSITPPGLVRDENVWHLHPRIQDDRMLVVSGAIVLAVADKRENSQTRDILNIFYMQADKSPYIILVPRGILHSFMAVSKTPAILLNFPTALYNLSEEGRLPYQEAHVLLPNGTPFSWREVRKEFSIMPA